MAGTSEPWHFHITFPASNGVATWTVSSEILSMTYLRGSLASLYVFFSRSIISTSLLLPVISRWFRPVQGRCEIWWTSSVVILTGLSTHNISPCTRQSNCLMTNIVMGGWRKCGISRRQSNLAFSTFCNHFFGYRAVTAPSILWSIKASIARWGNFVRFARS